MFGQVVIGPPGSGKSTYCKHMAELLKKVGRKVAIVNLDPGNEINENVSVDIMELITIDDVMVHNNLGPNGSLVFCMEYLNSNIDWLQNKISQLKDHYLIVDCAGQVELYTHHNALKTVLNVISSTVSLCAVHLVDSHCCSDGSKFVSCVLTSLTAMLHISLPHINVLSKVDDMAKFSDRVQFGLDFYSEVLDLSMLIESLQDDNFTSKLYKLNSALISLIEDYSLVSFYPLNVKDDRMLINIKKAVDRANGYCYGINEERNVQSLLACAVSSTAEQERIGLDRDAYSFNDDLHC